jgi:cytochrome c-type biogenesis protein CcmH
VVCASGTVNDSPAGVAGDLRRLIRRLVLEGRDDAAIIDHIHARYGDYVLLRPPLRPGTVLLWLAPFLLITAGIWVYAGLLFPKNGLAQKLKSWVSRVKSNRNKA